MFINLRRRLQSDSGVSLIEMMIAMFILTVGILALLSTFSASARAMMEQRAKAGATRVASHEVEALRTTVWSGVQYQTLPYTETRTETIDGRPYTITTVVRWADPAVTAGAAEALKEIETTVAWTVGGVARSATVHTAVEGTATPPTDAQLVVDMIPAPIKAFRITSTPNLWRPVNTAPQAETGCPVGKICVRIQLQRWEYNGQLRLKWTNADGSARSVLINKTGDEWVTQLPATTSPDPTKDIRATLDTDEEGFMDFTIEAVTASLSTSYRLALFGYNEYAPGFFVMPNGVQGPIPVDWHQQHGCHGTNRCRNVVDTWLYAALPADAPANTTVTLTWNQPGFVSIPLRRSGSNPAYWRVNVVRTGSNPHPQRPWEVVNSQFLPGNLTFTITVRETDTIVTQATYVRPVVVQ